MCGIQGEIWLQKKRAPLAEGFYDLLAGQTAKASIRFSCPNTYCIDQAGLLAGHTDGSAGRQTVQNKFTLRAI